VSENRSTAVLDAIRVAVRRLLRPLARVGIRAGLTFPAFNSLAREVFIEAALEDFAVDGKPPSHSRVAILSGVHRKEIRRFTEQDRSLPGPPPALPLSAKVIAVWTSDPTCLDETGRPRPLPRSAPDDRPSFDRLVTSVSTDVRPRSLLDEWLRQGVVMQEGDLIRLRRPAFLPDQGFEDKAYYFGRNLRDHIAAGAHNLAGEQPAFFDRAVYYDRLTPESIEELRQLAEEKAMALLLDLNRKASALAARDRKHGDGGQRCTLGAFYFAESTGSNEPEKAGGAEEADQS
jgi:hypothetical protein